MPPRIVAVTYQAMPPTMFSLETDLDREAATAEVKKGTRKPWKNLKISNVDKLEVHAQAIWQIIIRMAAIKDSLTIENFSLSMPEGRHPTVIPANTRDTDRED